MAPLDLHRLVGVHYRPGTPSAPPDRSDPSAPGRFLPTLAEWFASPFVGLEPRITAILADGRTVETPGPLPEHVGVSQPLAGEIRRVAAGGAGPPQASSGSGPPRSLVDRYLLGSRGALSTADYGAVATAVLGTGTVLLECLDEPISAVHPSALVALLLTEAIVQGFGSTVGHGRRGLIADFRSGPGAVHRPGLASLLPVPAGLPARAALLDAAATAVPVGLYPIFGSLLPEVSGTTTPTTESARAVLCDAPGPTGRLVALGPVRREGQRLTPFLNAPLRSTREAVPRAGSRVLRRMKSELRRRPAAATLRALGIDPDVRHGLVTRLDVPQSGNPWLDRAGRRFLGRPATHAPTRSASA